MCELQRDAVKRDVCVNIVKQGYLFIKRPPKNGFIRFKSWHKRYFVLRDETMEHPSRLEMYQKEGDFSKNHSTRFVLNLDKVIHVGRAEDSKRFRQAFMVVCVGRSPILLAEEDAMCLNSWLLAVTLIAEKRSDHHQGAHEHHCAGCHHTSSSASSFRRSFSGGESCPGGADSFDPSPTYFNDPSFDDGLVKRYEVSVESTSTSRRNGIEGDYVLSIRPWGLSLSKAKHEDEYIVNWPLGYIRKFKSESLPQSYYKKRYYVVTLELGRRCATGEGILQFHTVHGKEIIADMNAAICRSMTTKLHPEDSSCKRGLTRSRQSLSVGSSSQGSYGLFGGWRGGTKDSSSSLNIKTSVSRQSSGGNTSVSRFNFSDHEQQIMEASPYANGGGGLGGGGPFPRSPLLSDSSSASAPQFHNGSSRHASLTSSASSSSSTSALSSSNRSASGESGQYVEAEFNREACSSSPPRLALCPHSRRPSRVKGPPEANEEEAEARGSEEEKKIAEDKAAKAAAEGYLEVLPDLFCSTGKSLETSSAAAQEELFNIYHVLDFSKPNNVVRHLSTGGLGVNEPGGGKAKLRSPRSSLADCSPDLTDVIEMNGAIAHLRKLSGGGRKPPAPLPRPEHTMLPK